MERVTIEKAKRLFGNNFVGLEELRPLFEKMRLSYVSVQVPIIQYSLFKKEKKENIIPFLIVVFVNNLPFTFLILNSIRLILNNTI